MKLNPQSFILEESLYNNNGVSVLCTNCSSFRITLVAARRPLFNKEKKDHLPSYTYIQSTI